MKLVLEVSISWIGNEILFFVAVCFWASESKVVEDFAAENVVYLELRTTPKVLDGSSLRFCLS